MQARGGREEGTGEIDRKLGKSERLCETAAVGGRKRRRGRGERMSEGESNH